MPTETVHTLVIGAGQAGIAASEHLSARGIEHLVVERDRIAERWRTQRWDSLVANGPAWHDRFPGATFRSCGPDDFPGKDDIATYFADYARAIGAPVRTGVAVNRLERNDGAPGFTAETSTGRIRARAVIVATGPFQNPAIPAIAPDLPDVTQIHSSAYRNPSALPEGAVVVIGAGSSGAQIAQELMEAGRRVILAVGPHDRPPRRYRGRDFVWWLGVLGKWDAQTPGPGTEHVTIAVSGAHGGRTVDFRDFAHRGMRLVGRARGFDGHCMHVGDDLRANIEGGDRNMLALMDEADAFVRRNGLDLPEEPEARLLPPDPDCLLNPVETVDLRAERVGTIIWATGFAQDFGWIRADAFDAQGRPRHQRGVSTERGLYFLGLPWLSRRGSSFIWGVWHDAAHVADQIVIQKGYDDYRGTGQTANWSRGNLRRGNRPAGADTGSSRTCDRAGGGD